MNNLPIFFLLAFLGLFLGYLINYLSDVLPRTRNFSKPICPKCESPKHFREYIFLRDCANCGIGATLRFKLVLVFSAFIVALLWLYPPHHLVFWLSIICYVYLAVIAIIDLEHRVILNQMAIAGIILGLITGFSINGLIPTLIGGAAGFGIMLALYFLGELFSRYMAKKRGIESDEVALGFGDVNLGGILGLMLGWPVILVCLLFAILFGGLISAGIVTWMLIKHDYKPFIAIPYAPFMIISGSVLLYLLK
jgi:leader peptidase (prepilin peptidase)/N-methyltransferase